MSLQIEPINPDNIEHVVALLVERNNTLPEYTRWKYDRSEDNLFRGVVARMNGKAVGCFGSVPRDLKLPSGEVISCNWFADWYVTPQAQGQGVGKRLLQALSAEGKIVFGHPGPTQAQALCKQDGYREIGFQSCRRLALKRWHYEKKRTHYSIKAAGRFAAGLYRSGLERLKANFRKVNKNNSPAARFTTPETYRQWILAQPTIAQVSRSYGKWSQKDIGIEYVDDRFETGLIRRRVLHSSGEHSADFHEWMTFIENTKQDGCHYVEIFTTEQDLDLILMKWGAWRIVESPIVVKGVDIKNLYLHGWDRENWTFVASAKDQP